MMRKDMKIRIMTALMAGTFAFGFMAGPVSSSTMARGTIHVNAAEASMTFKDATAKDAKQSKKKVKEITEDKALEIALKDAGVSADAANVTKKHIDHDDGVAVYDIEFISGDKEYEYEIDVKTGAIHDKDIDSIYDD